MVQYKPAMHILLYFFFPTPVDCGKGVIKGEKAFKRHPLLHQTTVAFCQALMFGPNKKSKVE